MKRHILYIGITCIMACCAIAVPSCIGDDATTFALEAANPRTLLSGTWRVKDIFRNSQSALSSLNGSIALPSGQSLRIGSLLRFPAGTDGLAPQSGNFQLFGFGNAVTLPWKFTTTVIDGQPYTGGILLDGKRFAIRCWTPERWIFYPDGDDDPWYIELEHDGDDDTVTPEPTPTPTPEPASDCGPIVRRIVKTAVNHKGGQTYTSSTTYTFSYTGSDYTPSGLSIQGSNSANYIFSGQSPIILLEGGSAAKTASLTSGYITRETRNSLDLTATAEQSSGYWSSYRGELNAHKIAYTVSRGNPITFTTSVLNSVFDEYRWTLGSVRNNTNINLNYFLSALFNSDPGRLFPFAVFNYYGRQETNLISAEWIGFTDPTADYHLERTDYVVSTNECGFPEEITFKEYSFSKNLAADTSISSRTLENEFTIRIYYK